ncbi:MAG: hypothetical protein KJ058_06555 [Thermoanaerobaculia bacterium]|nr:hypothetical protein [Thermoanaerobaculia bacterium]
MADVEQAVRTQLENLQEKTGKSLAELSAWLADPTEVDAELAGWIRAAFDAAG